MSRQILRLLMGFGPHARTLQAREVLRGLSEAVTLPEHTHNSSNQTNAPELVLCPECQSLSLGTPSAIMSAATSAANFTTHTKMRLLIQPFKLSFSTPAPLALTHLLHSGGVCRHRPPRPPGTPRAQPHPQKDLPWHLGSGKCFGQVTLSVLTALFNSSRDRQTPKQKGTLLPSFEGSDGHHCRCQGQGGRNSDTRLLLATLALRSSEIPTLAVFVHA